MAGLYNKKQIFEDSKKLIVEKNLLFVQDIIDLLPCSKATFYLYFPDSSNELDELRDLLNENKVNGKIELRNRWKKSDNSTLQLALYRLMASPDEHRMLNQHYIDHTSGGEPLNIRVIEADDNEHEKE
jgi:hypothetical protein